MPPTFDAPASGLMEYKAMPLEVKALPVEGQYEGYFSVAENRDDGGDTIHHGAFKKTIAERASRIHPFYLHDWEKLVGPPPQKILEDAHGLYVAGKLTTGAFWGRETWALLSDGALTEGSIGYEAVKQDTQYDGEGFPTRDLWELKLFEYSFVPLGMNALTQVRAVKAAMIAMFKSAIPPKSAPKADEGLAWDAAAVLKDVEGAKQLRLIHAWVDPEGDPEDKSSYKLPHHLADGTVVWKGVSAAGNVTMGSRGGSSIPEADIPGVQKHLELHYGQFAKDPPWKKSATIDTHIETLLFVTEALKEGRVLSGSNKEKVRAAVDALVAASEALQALLAAAEPAPAKGHYALTAMSRVRAAELALALAEAQP